MLPKDIQSASYKGVGFLCPKDKIEQGRNTVLHRWPDSNVQYAEDNGFTPPEYKLTIILADPNLLGKVAALRRVLNSPGPGTLKHPYVGSKQCSVKGPWSADRDDHDAGVWTAEVCFVETVGAIFPALISGIPAVVSGLAASTIASISSQFAGVFGAGPLSAVSRVAIGAGVGAIGSSLSSAFGASLGVSTLVNQAQSMADQPDRIATLLSSAVTDPLTSDVFTAAQLVQGMKAVSEQASGVVNDAVSFANRIGM
jgi:hypothetical protein